MAGDKSGNTRLNTEQHGNKETENITKEIHDNTEQDVTDEIEMREYGAALQSHTLHS